MANTIVGVYDDYQDAQAALNDLLRSGFEIEHVRLSPEEESANARQTALRNSEAEQGGSHGISGFFRNLFGSHEKERYPDLYSEAVRRGSYLLTVHTNNDEQESRASAIMNQHHPIDIEERASAWQSQGWSSYDRNAVPYTETEITTERSRYPSRDQSALLRETSATRDQTSIPVIQEELQVGKREVQRGGVRIHQHVTESPVSETVHLREEHVSVERRPVDEPATAADLASLKEGTFEMRETAEEAVVAKTARVVEEVVLGRETSETEQTINDTVRRSDVDVERLGNPGDDNEFRTHWTSQYGSTGGRFEEYAPAYQYGARMASDTRYKNYRFSDVEPEIERDWRQQNAGRPWEKMKDAVRYGWERVSR